MKFLFCNSSFHLFYMRSSNTFNDTNLKLRDREDTIPMKKCHVFPNSMENKNKIMFFSKSHELQPISSTGQIKFISV